MRVERKVLTGAVGWSSEYCFGDAASVGDEEALAPVGFYGCFFALRAAGPLES